MVDQPTSSNEAVDIPDGLTEEWVIEKSRHLNDKFMEWSGSWMPRIDENYALFEGKAINGMRPGAVPFPIANSIIDTNMGRFMSAINGREKLVDAVQKSISVNPMPMPQPAVVPGGAAAPAQEDPTKRVILVEDLINESMTSTPDFMDKCDEMFKLLLLETICVVETYWDKERYSDRIVTRDIDPMTGQPLPQGEEYVENERAFPCFTPVSIRHLAWDPREKWNIGKSSWVRKREMVSVDHLQELAEKGYISNLDAVLKDAPKSGQHDQKKDPDAQRAKIEGHSLPNLDFSDSLYQLDEFWAKLAFKQQGKLVVEEFRWWLIGDKVLVKFEKNPRKPARKPFISAKLNRKPGMLLGQGPMDVVKPLLINIANTMLSKDKLVRAAATTPTFVEPSAGLDTRKLLLEENVIIPVLNAKGVVQGQPPVQAIGLLDAHIGMLIGQAKEATAANDLMQGTGSSSSDTATEAKILEAGAATRFQYNFEMVMNSVFAPLAKEYFLLYKQYGEDGKMTIREAGVDGKATLVLVDDLKGDYDFKAIASQALQNRMGRFRLLEEMLTKLMTASAQNPAMLMTKDGATMKLMPYEFITEQMLPLVDVKGSGTLFRVMTPQEMMQEQMKAQQMQMMQMMGGRPNPGAPNGGAPNQARPAAPAQPGAE